MGSGQPDAAAVDVVALVTSTGGLEALSTVLRGLPDDLPAAIVVQQHLSGSGSMLVEILRRRTRLAVEWAQPRTRLRPGRVVVAPPLKRLEVFPDGTCAVHEATDVLRDSPHDGLLTSLADSYAVRALAVVLTGMGRDGAAGARALTGAGGVVIAQSRDTAEQPSMPEAAAEAGADLVLPLHEIAGVVVEVVLGAPLPRAPDELQAIRATFGDEGRIAALARETDWSKHRLGPVRQWPPALRTALRLAAAYPTPFTVLWGPDLIHFYNDAAIASHGDDHPRIFARPTFDSYPHRRDTEPMLRSVLAGQTVQRTRALIPTVHNGKLTDAWFDLVYAPIPDADGTFAGLTCAWNERTSEVTGSRRLETLNRLTAVPALAGPAQVLTDTLAVLEGSPDIAFCLAYRIEAHVHAKLVSAFGVPDGSAMAPQVVRLAPGSAWPLQRMLDAQDPVVVDDLVVRFRGHVVGAERLTPDVAVLHPLRDDAKDQVAGVLVLGATGRVPFDDRYREFLTLVGQTVSAKVAESYAREREAHRLTQLAELDRAKTEFFSNVSHEFRTPLTLMLAPLSDALRRADALPDGLASELEVAQRNAQRLLRLVGTLLDFSQLEAGRLRARYRPTDLAALTSEVASMFRSAAQMAGLKLAVDAPPLSEPVWVDPEMWEKIVSNLVSNALKYTWTGGVEVRLRALPKHAELVVHDTGTGIPADHLPHVLKRFHRVPRTRGRTHEGAGIGLALVDELVRRHHGRIRITSDEGAGTTVTVWIPLGRRPVGRTEPDEPPRTGRVAAAMAEEASQWDATRDDNHAALGLDKPEGAADISAAMTRGARLLVVDDNADMRDYLSRLLGSAWQVTAARDGAEALALARANPPDLVLADVMMPVLDGFELLRAIRADDGLATTPVVLLTARAGEETAIEGLLAGADDYVVKPFAARELVARVAAQLELAAIRRRVAEVNEFLLRFSDAVRGLTDPHRVAHAACRMLNEQLGTDRTAWADVDWRAREYVADCVVLADGRQGEPTRWPLGEDDPLTTQHLAGRPVTYVDVDVDTRIPDTMKREMRRRGLRAGVAVPVVVDGTLRGVLSTSQREPRSWTSEDVGYVEALAGRAQAEIKRARAEAALRESDGRFRLAENATGAFVYEWDLAAVTARSDAGNPMSANAADEVRRSLDALRVTITDGITAVLGYSQEEAPRSRGAWRAMIHPDDVERVTADYEVGLHAGRYAIEYRLRHKDGRYVDVIDRGLTIKNESGELTRIIGSVVDITERKRAETALRQSEARYRALATASADVIYRMSPDWREMRQLDGRGFLSDTATPSDSWLHRYIHPDDYAQVTEAINEAVQGKRMFEIEHRVVRADGTLGRMFSRAVPILDEDGHIVEWVGAATNVTGRMDNQQTPHDSRPDERPS